MMMNSFSNVRSIERINRVGRISNQMSKGGFFGNTSKEKEVAFSDMLQEACKHNEDSLARTMENKVSYYGSDAQAVYYTMTMSRSFKA